MKKMKLVVAALALFAILTVAVSCGGGNSSVNSAMEQIEKALEQIEKNKDSMTMTDWMIIEKELREPMKILEEALDNGEINAVQQMKIAATLFQAAPALTEAAFRTSMESTDLVIDGKLLTDSIANAIEQMKETLSEEQLQEAQKELENAIKEIEEMSKKK